MKPPKYKAKPQYIEGRRFASGMEADRARILQTWLAYGIISELEYQPRFLLQEAFRDNRGRLNRKIDYVADFSYIEEGRSIIEDVKGMPTQAYLLKAKLFRAKYPELVHKEIKNGKDMLTHKPKKRKGKTK